MIFHDLQPFILTGLSSGALSTIATLYWTGRWKKVDLRIVELREQLRNLYGPLHFFALQNEKLFKLSDDFIQAHRDTPLRKEDSATTLELANLYGQRSIQNNDAIYEILKNNFLLIDLDDADIFAQMMVDYLRLKHEWDSTAKPALRTPLLVYKQIGDISLMRSAFIEKVKEKFDLKKAEMASYSKVGFIVLRWRKCFF